MFFLFVTYRCVLAAALSKIHLHYKNKYKGIQKMSQQHKLFDIIDYENDPKLLMHALTTYLTKSSKNNKKPFAVFDIDDTLLSTCDSNDTICEQKVGRYLFDKCKELHIPVYLVTARLGCPSSQDYAEKQLKTLQFSGYKALYMQSKHDSDTSAYKSRIREEITQSTGGVCVLNVGDQFSDHFTSLTPEEESTVACILNPNTYYVLKVYEDAAQLSVKFAEVHSEDDDEA